MSRLIDADALKRQYEERKRLFCRNRIEFSTLSDKDKARVDELDNCIADTLNAPTIEERKTGRWLMDGEKCGELMWRCSECKISEVVPTATSFVSGITYPQWRFCPNCGAKMEGGED